MRIPVWEGEMRTKFSRVLILLVLVTFLTAAFLPQSLVQAQGVPLGGIVPVLLSPHDTILAKNPTYKWTPVFGAEVYQYQVWKGSTKVLDKSPDADICSDSLCERTPAFTLGYYAYKWRVRARIDGSWKAWSAYMNFTVSPPSFSSTFNNEMNGWAKMSGKDYYKSSTYIYTLGMANWWSTLRRTSGQYTDFKYSANMKRPSGYSPNYLVIRMGSNTLPTNGRWYPGYYFGYDNWGNCFIFEMSTTGSSTTLFYKPACPVNKMGWNVITVEAIGYKFWFYVNGSLMKFFTDLTFPRGYVGIASYRNSTASQTFYVDWAKLVVKETAQ